MIKSKSILKFINQTRNLNLIPKFFISSFYKDEEQHIIWLPVIFACGIIFYFSNDDFISQLTPISDKRTYFLPIILLSFSTFLIVKRKFINPLFFYLILIFSIFIAGFLWAKFYSEKIAFNHQIKNQFYATIKGEITDLKIYKKDSSNKESYKIILKNIDIYKVGFLPEDDFDKKEDRNFNQYSKKIILAKKPKKIGSNIIKTYLNLDDYQEIDREFLSFDYKNLENNWQNNRYIFAPKRLSLSINTKLNNAKIGDKIIIRAILKPFSRNYLPGGFNARFYNYFQNIGGTGFATNDIKILQKYQTEKPNSLIKKINLFRNNIAQKILEQIEYKEEGAILIALILGIKDFIDKDNLQNIRDSGLAHLIAISGLHFTMVAAICFFIIRFVLSLNQYLTLNYDIRKIAAFITIFITLFYLLLVNSPISAIRAFIFITTILIAILLDLKANIFRVLALSALIILIISPNSIFLLSFQLSFAAILGLISSTNLFKKFNQDKANRSLIEKILFYLLGIILTSTIAAITTSIFIAYNFNQVPIFSILANLVAIPLISFFTMPLAILFLILNILANILPFLEIIEIFILKLAISSIKPIIVISAYISNLDLAILSFKTISKLALSSIIFGGLWLLIWQKSWRFLGLLPIIIGIYLGYKTKLPDILIDGEKKLAGIYFEERLILLKKSQNKQIELWKNKLGLQEINNIDDLTMKQKEKLKLNCNQMICRFNLKNKNIVLLFSRNKVTSICNEQQNKYFMNNDQIIINLSNKYKIPDCFEKKPELIIDNKDLQQNYGYFLSFK